MTMQSARSLTETAEEAVHVWRHRGLAVSMGLGYAIWRRLLQPNTPTLERKTVETLAKRFERLLQQDLANARAGYYPRSLLHQFPLFDYLARMPEALLELPRVLLRSYRGRYDDLPAEAKPETYPRYYRRTFHWQSDGWLSDRSARIYDTSVDFLFGGTADVMRRVLKPGGTVVICDSALLRECGFEVVSAEPFLVSKVVVARKA